MDSASCLDRWDVPFTLDEHPSVTLVSNGPGSATLLVVAPHGVDRYPKYLVRFDQTVATLVYEDALELERNYPAFQHEGICGCAFIWNNSPWLQGSQYWASMLQGSTLRHYLIFGGDDIVEVLALGSPAVERIDETRSIETRHQI